MPEEAVSPNHLLPTQAALVRPQPAVSLEVLGEMVLHLERLGADRAPEWPQIEVLHLHVTVAHALQGVCFAAVAEVDLARVGGSSKGHRG